MDIFDICLHEDDPLIHPDFLCNACRSVLFRYRSTRKKSSNTTVNIKLYQYHPHSIDCQICSSNNPGCSTDNVMDELLQLFSSLEISEKLECIAKMIGHVHTNQDMKNIIQNHQKSFPYNNLKTLESIDINEYINQFDQLVIQCVLALTGKTTTTIKVENFIPVLESIYRLCDPQFIGAWSFMQNLVVYSFTKNKTACNVLGTAIPGAKYATVYNFVSDINIGRETNCPSGDVIFVFDNEQVIGRSWNINANNKVKMSVITNVAAIKVTENKNLQQNESLTPGKWITSEGKENIIESMCQSGDSQDTSTDFYSDIKQNHYNELYHVLDLAIQQVSEEVIFDEENNLWKDHVDKTIVELEIEQKYKKCPRCGCLFEKNKRKCSQCHEALIEAKTTKSTDGVKQKHFSRKSTVNEYGISKPVVENPQKYSHVESSHNDIPAEICLLDPVFVNPNSIDSIVLVLRHIGKKGRISKYLKDDDETPKRFWTFVCCDGLPHGLVRRVVEEYFVCLECEEGFLGIKNVEDHEVKAHPNTRSRYVQEFDWVFLICGDGHYEMNLMKSFMELNWNVCMKSLVEVMGFRSEKAQKSALACSDNHKTWQLIMIFHLGTILELVKPYVEKCLHEKHDPSPQDYISYVKTKSDNANYLYLFEMVCRYTQAIINIRMAVRRNNYILLQAGKFMSKELFHGRNHPKYQDIEVFDHFVHQLMPVELKTHFASHCSLSKSGNKSKGQGFDFILEEENKSVKTWLKRGVPTEKVWLSTCRNNQSLKQIKKSVTSIVGSVYEDLHGKEPDLEAPINEWRLRLRQTGYISDQKHGPVLTSISADILDQELLYFTRESNRKRGYRIMDMLLHQPPPNDPSIHHPVYILPSEREKYLSVDSLTIQEIDNKILDTIDDLDEINKLMFLDLYREMIRSKTTRKEDHIKFLEEISTAAAYLDSVDGDSNFLNEELENL